MLGHASCSFIIICLAARTDRINTTVSLHLSFSPRSSLLSYILLLLSFPFPSLTPSLSRAPDFLLVLIYFLWFLRHCFPPSVFIVASSLTICAEELEYWGCYLRGRDERDLAYTS